MLVLRSGDIRDHCRYSKNSPDKPPIRVDHILHDGHEKTEIYIAGRTKRALLPSPRRTLARRRPNMVQQPLRADSIDSFDDLAAAFLKQHLRFALDDLVFCKTDDDTIYGLGKFGSDWEGPFRIAKVVKPGIYQLEDNLGTTSDRLWSSSDLCKSPARSFEVGSINRVSRARR
ncbi:unnamed protein product [Microthlaspi erraticum]|uniref:Uncharacterized protein n=1 Tax=Microthlaspi erraticum TaxID=1685480 RepID=A0A6D2HEV5_9BRAS|nr:unnamed protein product [Microthlaspi erraticum]